MKNSILEFIKKEIKGFFSFIYWCVVIGIVSSYSGFQNTVLIVLAFIVTKIKILQGGNK